MKSNVTTHGSREFILGKKFYISSYLVLGINEKVTIGYNVMIADNFSLRDTDHKFDNINQKPISEKQPINKETRIELENYFQQDIKKTSALIDRKLEHWFKEIKFES